MTTVASGELDLLSSNDSPVPHNKWNRPDDVLQSPPAPIVTTIPDVN